MTGTPMRTYIGFIWLLTRMIFEMAAEIYTPVAYNVIQVLHSDIGSNAYSILPSSRAHRSRTQLATIVRRFLPPFLGAHRSSIQPESPRRALGW